MLTPSYIFFILGGFNVARLAWTDIKEFMVDQRVNTLMLGVVLTLYFISGRVLEMIVVGFVGIYLLGELKKHKLLFGLSEGDLSMFAWLIPGFWFVGWLYLIIFYCLWAIGMGLMKFVVVKSEKFAVSVPIVFAFCLTWCVWVVLV